MLEYVLVLTRLSVVFLKGLPEMPSVTFLQYFVLLFDENTSKIQQDLGKYCFFLLKFTTTHVY